MSVRQRARPDHKTGVVTKKWIVDIDFEHPDGRRAKRLRKVSPVQTRRGAEQYERDVRQALLDGTYGRKEAAPAPTLNGFTERFIEDWCKANKQKPSGIDSKESALRNYLAPVFGDRRLDSFEPVDEDKLKKVMSKYAASTYNNAASTLNMVVRVAHRWGVIKNMPHRFGQLKRQKARPRFYDFDQFEWLVEASMKVDARIHLVTLLGGEAGLRRGEILALEWGDVDLRRGQLTVSKSQWKGHSTNTKGMKFRVVPMTHRLKQALAAHRHLRGDRVLYTDDGEPVTAKVLQKWMHVAQKRAGLLTMGSLHVLRHTFCSHLAMRGAPALSIQKLAGHESLTTTLGYMHLAPGETERAIGLLDDRREMLTSGTLAAPTARSGSQVV